MTEKLALRKTISASISHGRTPLNFTAPVDKIKPVMTLIVMKMNDDEDDNEDDLFHVFFINIVSL